MPLRFAFETILFGADLDDFDAAMGLIAQFGFEGVEIAQPPHRILATGVDGTRAAIEPKHFAETLQRHGLTLLGMAGGSFEERARFCSEAGVVPQYWYVADTAFLDRSYRDAAREAGTRLAFHPHAFLAYDRIHPIAYLDDPEYSEVAWLPDTAHMTIMGGGFGILERMLRRSPERIAGIHLKDWDPAYGRSYHRYAKGFAPLGRGIVPLSRVARMIREVEAPLWVVVEQDYAKGTAFRAMRAAVRWIQSQGIDRDDRLRLPPVAHESLPNRDGAPAVSERFPALASDLAAASAESIEESQRTIAEALRRYFDCDLVALHAYRPGRDLEELFSLLAVASRTGSESTQLPDLVSDPHGALSRSVATKGPLLETDSSSGSAILTMPVLNRFNHHHIRFVVEARWADPVDAWPRSAVEGLADLLAEAADGALDDACGYAMGKVQGIASRRQSVEILDEIRDLVRELIDCEGVTVFLANPAGDRLDPWSTTGLAWREDLPPHRRFYGAHTDQRSPSMRVWKQREILTMVNGQETPHESASWETGVSQDRDNILLAPLVGTVQGEDGEERTEAIGVVRCRNKRVRATSLEGGVRGPGVRCFNQDDAAVLDAICQAAVPHIRLLVADVRRRKSVADMTHELSKPVNAVRAAVDKLRSDLGRIDKVWLELVDSLGPGIPESDLRRLREFALEGHRKYFRQDYIKNILSWTRLMVRVIGNADVYGLRSAVPDLETEPVLLMADVVAPAVDMAEHLLRRRGFEKSSIRYDNFAVIPRLHVDVNLFQQVVFNLLSNAIKYAYNDPARFGIEIATRVQGDDYCIHFRDWGPGIDAGHEKSIFEEGVRGPEHVNDLVGGLGLGLWVVREVVRLHGGEVEVTRVGDPTEITLRLPRSLASSKPRPRAQPRSGWS